MTPLLPPDAIIDDRDQLYGDAPLEFWLPALEAIRARHSLPSGTWTRFRMGKNGVFHLDHTLVVKLIPPCWAEDAAREAEALRLVGGQLPVETPTLLVADRLDGWTVLVTPYLAGTMLSDLWRTLTPDERAALAEAMGEVTRVLHGLPVAADSPLATDWGAILQGQRADLPGYLAEAEAPAHLQADLHRFLDEAGPLPTPGAPDVFLHGDLSAPNWMVEQRDGQWVLSGLLDFGDASLGEATHDIISPVVHTFRGEAPVLAAFYKGYGLRPSRELQHHIMARIVLYYYWGYLHGVTGVITETDSWERIGQQFLAMA